MFCIDLNVVELHDLKRCYIFTQIYMLTSQLVERMSCHDTGEYFIEDFFFKTSAPLQITMCFLLYFELCQFRNLGDNGVYKSSNDKVQIIHHFGTHPRMLLS